MADLTQFDDEFEEAIKSSTVYGSGWNMNPLNFDDSFDAFGIMKSPDLLALQYKDVNFNAESYLQNIALIKPDFAQLMQSSGVDMKILRETQNANEFWWHVNRQTAMIGAGNTIATWKDMAPAYQE